MANTDQLKRERWKSTVNEVTNGPHGQWFHVWFFSFYALPWHKDESHWVERHSSNFEIWMVSWVRGVSDSLRDDAGQRLPVGPAITG